MTCDERLEALLNRAGQTISDLPRRYAWQYILHLTDVLDRMELALENVCGERDWLRSMVCEFCDMETGGPSCSDCPVSGCPVKTGVVPEK